MVKAGKVIGAISPILAVGAMALMLFGPLYGYQSGDSEGNFSTGAMSALRFALEGDDDAWFIWSGFVVAVCLLASVAALTGKAAPVWVCAGVLWVVAGLGMWSIGLFVLPLSIVLFASAALLTVARYEPRSH
jgi:hypothetical protein